jgi:hypothetical protein
MEEIPVQRPAVFFPSSDAEIPGMQDAPQVI